jgi:hypothetical protein
MLSLWLLGAALYAAHAVYTRESKCASEVAETAAGYSVKDDAQQTGSVNQAPPSPMKSHSPRVGTELSHTGEPTQGSEVSLAARAHALPSVGGIKVIDPTALQEGWISGKYLAPKDHQTQALPQQPAETASNTSAVSEQPEPLATPKNLRRQQAWKRRAGAAFRYELGFYPTRECSRALEADRA